MNRRANAWRFAAALALGASVVQCSGETSVIRVDGMIVDLLETSSHPMLDRPVLSMDMEARAGTLARRPLESPPVSPPEREQAARHFKRAVDYANQREFQKALLEVRDGLAFSPGEPQLLSLAATLSAQRGDMDASAGFFQRYLEFRPADLPHTAAYVATLLRLFRMDDAERALLRAEAMNADYMPFRFHRACLDLAADRFKPARDYWRRRMFDDIHSAAQWIRSDRMALAQMVGAADMDRLAEDIFGPGTAATADSIADALAAAVAARAAKDWPAAIDALRNALALGADVYGIEATLADALHAVGDHNGAIRVWTDLSGRYPDHAQAWVSLGQALLRVSRFDEAMTAIRKAKELSPTEPAIDFLFATGLALSGSIPEAQAAYADLVLRRPADVRAWLETDAVFEAALDRLPNRTAILRRLDIPPEIE